MMLNNALCALCRSLRTVQRNGSVCVWGLLCANWNCEEFEISHYCIIKKLRSHSSLLLLLLYLSTTSAPLSSLVFPSPPFPHQMFIVSHFIQFVKIHNVTVKRTRATFDRPKRAIIINHYLWSILPPPQQIQHWYTDCISETVSAAFSVCYWCSH